MHPAQLCGGFRTIFFCLVFWSKKKKKKNDVLHVLSLAHTEPFDNVICDRLWENPAYGIRALFAQCAFLVAQLEICQSPDFVIYMSNNPSSNCCRLLRRLVVLYEGEISLHFDPPSQHSHRTRSPLLWAVINLDTARFIDLLYVRSPF